MLGVVRLTAQSGLSGSFDKSAVFGMNRLQEISQRERNGLHSLRGCENTMIDSIRKDKP
jgi:hypothetical protein